MITKKPWGRYLLFPPFDRHCVCVFACNIQILQCYYKCAHTLCVEYTLTLSVGIFHWWTATATNNKTGTSVRFRRVGFDFYQKLRRNHCQSRHRKGQARDKSKRARPHPSHPSRRSRAHDGPIRIARAAGGGEKYDDNNRRPRKQLTGAMWLKTSGGHDVWVRSGRRRHEVFPGGWVGGAEAVAKGVALGWRAVDGRP